MSTVDLLTVLLLAGIALPAQTPPADADAARAKELLNSPTLADRAWGAYYAGRLRDAGLQDILVERLRAAQPLANARMFSPEFSYIAGLFDALIEIGGAVPLDAFMPFEARWREPALILLSRQQGTEDTLLAMRDELTHQDLYWLAVNNLLFGMRSARFFTKTLEEIRITHTFDVRQGAFREPGSGTGSSIVTGAPPKWPDGFPPAGLYYIEVRPTEGALLVAGPRNVYFRRGVPPVGVEGTWRDPGLEVFRLEYMEAWNHGALVDAQRAFTPQTVVQWKDATALTREVEARLDEQTAAIRAYVATAKQNGAPDMAGLHLRIAPVLKDNRQNRLAPLPAVQPREFTLE
jgi:hypothetical protein